MNKEARLIFDNSLPEAICEDRDYSLDINLSTPSENDLLFNAYDNSEDIEGDNSEDLLPRIELENITNELVPHLVRLNANYDRLIGFFPEVESLINENFPGFTEKLTALNVALDEVQGSQTINRVELEEIVDTYNSAAQVFNMVVEILSPSGSDEEAGPEIESLADASNIDNYRALVEELEEEEALALEEAANEIIQELFPESYIERQVINANGEEELADWQRLALAIPIGIEHAGGALVEVINPRNWDDIWNGGREAIRAMLNADDRAVLLGLSRSMWEASDPVDRAATAISFITSFVFLTGAARSAGALTRLPSLLSRSRAASLLGNLSGTASSLVELAYFGNRGRYIPAGIIAGLTVPYLN